MDSKETGAGAQYASVKARLAREAARILVERKVVRSDTESVSSSFSASEESAEGEWQEESRKVEKESASGYRKSQVDGSTKCECLDPDFA